MQGKALPGFRDFYPEDLTLRNHIFATWRSVAARYGFEEYDGPPLESLEMYTQKSGDEIVQQLYSFRDKGEREGSRSHSFRWPSPYSIAPSACRRTFLKRCFGKQDTGNAKCKRCSRSRRSPGRAR